MTKSEKVLLEFAGYTFIHKPELSNEINTLIANYINSNNTCGLNETQDVRQNEHTKKVCDLGYEGNCFNCGDIDYSECDGCKYCKTN